jgi:hypothetical protein
MGAVIAFPGSQRVRRAALHRRSGPATVVILPVIRIERAISAVQQAASEPSKSPSGGRRRGRASRA